MTLTYWSLEVSRCHSWGLTNTIRMKSVTFGKLITPRVQWMEFCTNTTTFKSSCRCWLDASWKTRGFCWPESLNEARVYFWLLSIHLWFWSKECGVWNRWTCGQDILICPRIDLAPCIMKSKHRETLKLIVFWPNIRVLESKFGTQY